MKITKNSTVLICNVNFYGVTFFKSDLNCIINIQFDKVYNITLKSPLLNFCIFKIIFEDTSPQMPIPQILK